MNRARPKRLAEKLLAVRRRLNLSQSQLARRIDPHIHYGRVSEWESGKRHPGVLILLAYAHLAGVHIDDLVDDNIHL
jgi:transcriptional regulator with XRE-family HTH domain